MPNRILALDLEGGHLAAVLVETSFRSYRFVSQMAVERDEERSLAEQLRDFLEAHRLEADTVLSALPARSASFRILELPFRDRRKIQQIVPFEIETQVPIALENAIASFQILSRGDSGTRVFAALAPRGAVEEHLKALGDAGLDPAIVDFSPLSTLNVLQLFEGDRPERYAFLHVRGGQTTLALQNGDGLEGLRVLDLGKAMAPESFLREVFWTLRSFEGERADPRSFDGLPVLVAGSLPEEVFRGLTGRLGLRLQRLEELPLRHVPDALRAEQGTFAAAIGLALREISEQPTVGLDFRQEEFAYQRGQQEIRGHLARLGGLAAAVLVLFLVSNFVSWWTLSSRYEELRDAVREVFVATLPGETQILDETLQLAQAIDGLRQRVQPGGSSASALEVLREASTLAPPEPRMNASELVFDGETLRLRGETESFEAVEEIKTKLSRSTLFQDVQVRDPRTNAEGRVEFRLNVLLGSGEKP